MAAYPEDLVRPALLRDGRSLLVRPVRKDDGNLLHAFASRLSRRTISFRMLGPVVALDERMTNRLLDADHVDHLVLVAILDGAVIGTAEYARMDEDSQRADIAFLVEDVNQGAGLGGLLLEHLAAAARERGITVFEADVLTDNLPMLRTFESSGYRLKLGDIGHIQHIELMVDPRRQVIARSDRRERVAVRSSLHALFAPRSVAVIGANRTGPSVGKNILANIVSGGFTGTVSAVNPNATQIDGVRCYPSITEVPGHVELAIVAVRAEAVSAVLEECADRGVSAAVVVTTGVLSPDTNDLARSLRARGMRLVGPNCMGVINLDDATRLVATFSPDIPPPGPVSMASQSGPLGLAVLDHANRIGLGFSAFVSIGDAVDVSPNDLLRWWELDASTSLVLLHLERFGNPRTFARVARRVAARKPIVAVQPGPSRGPRATAARPLRPADSDAAVTALFTQAGIIRTRTMQEMFDVALLLANQPVPAGHRVAILTNAGGPGALTAGACLAAGLELAELSDETCATLREGIVRSISASNPVDVSNPVDLTPMGGAPAYRIAMEALLADDGVDAVIALFIPPVVDRADEVAEALVTASARVPDKPVLASFRSQNGVPAELRGRDRAIPSYLFPESAASALGLAAEYGSWRRQSAGFLRDPTGLDVVTAQQIVGRLQPGRVDDAALTQLLSCFGLVRASASSPAPEAGRDLTLGVTTDPIFGPVVSLALAGDLSDLFDDVAFRITPISDSDAEAMLHSLRALALLDGSRGHPAVDLDAIIDVVTRVSAMVENVPELAEFGVNRMRVGRPGTGAILLDATMELTHPEPRRIPREPTVDAR